MKDNHSVMDEYIKLTEFLSQVCGNNFEFVLHIIDQPESSIIAIQNGKISGRTIGGPMSDLALKMLNGKYYEDNDYVVNRGATREGKVLASSTFFIKNNGQLIGMLCVNHDLTDMIGYSNNLLENLSSFGVHEGHNGALYESLERNVEDLMDKIYKNAMGNISVPPERMTPEEKVAVVAALENQGYFLLKGAVPEVASLLKVSEATIYRYLSKHGR